MLDPQRTDDDVIEAIVTEAGEEAVEKPDPTETTKNVTEGEEDVT